MKKRYFSKIMLFGEYAVMCHAHALAVPFDKYSGSLDYPKEREPLNHDAFKRSNQSLHEYASFLEKKHQQFGPASHLNLQVLMDDIKQGLYFDSSIPQGSGLGSSGALVASLYDHYAENKITIDDVHQKPDLLHQLKSIFSKMESYFHGQSSGLDPLICYMNEALLIKNGPKLQTMQLAAVSTENSGFFLLNSGLHAKTEPLVSYFIDQLKKQKFYKLLKDVLIPANNNCIEALIKCETDKLHQQISILSKFYWNHLYRLIPANLHSIWKEGMNRDDFKLKLCGSGGGGFVLGYSCNLEETRSYLSVNSHELIPLPY